MHITAIQLIVNFLSAVSTVRRMPELPYYYYFVTINCYSARKSVSTGLKKENLKQRTDRRLLLVLLAVKAGEVPSLRNQRSVTPPAQVQRHQQSWWRPGRLRRVWGCWWRALVHTWSTRRLKASRWSCVEQRCLWEKCVTGCSVYLRKILIFLEITSSLRELLENSLRNIEFSLGKSFTKLNFGKYLSEYGWSLSL